MNHNFFLMFLIVNIFYTFTFWVVETDSFMRMNGPFLSEIADIKFLLSEENIFLHFEDCVLLQGHSPQIVINNITC